MNADELPVFAADVEWDDVALAQTEETPAEANHEDEWRIEQRRGGGTWE